MATQFSCWYQLLDSIELEHLELFARECLNAEFQIDKFGRRFLAEEGWLLVSAAIRDGRVN